MRDQARNHRATLVAGDEAKGARPTSDREARPTKAGDRRDGAAKADSAPLVAGDDAARTSKRKAPPPRD